MQRRPAAALGGESEKLARVVDAVDAEAGFRQKMSVSPLSARRVENARSHRQPEDFDYPSCLGARALRREYRIVFPEVLRVEIAFPPLGLTTQKNTGSRYAPKTSSIAARISYSVQYARAASRI